jgi:hypothetical protein
MSSLRFSLEIEIIITTGKRDGFTYQRLAEQRNSSISEAIPPDDFHGYSHHKTK